MKRPALILAASVGPILVWLVLAGPVALRGQVAAQPPRAARQWEYAMVAYVSGKGASWEAPAGTKFGASFEELNQKLGLAKDASQSALFTLLGRDGWELTTHAMRTTGGAAPGIHAVWTFKRPVP